MTLQVKNTVVQSVVGHWLNNRKKENGRLSPQVLVVVGNSTTRYSWSAAAAELGYNLQHHEEIPRSVVDGYESSPTQQV